MDLAWMKTYIGDEAALTGHLTAEEFGAYERLRRHYWQHGHLPEDGDRLARIAGIDPKRWPVVVEMIASLFSAGWRLPRLDNERREAADKREKKIAAGRKGASVRWGGAPDNDGKGMAEPLANAMDNQWPPAPAPAPAPTPDEDRYEEGLALGDSEEFKEAALEPFPTEDEARSFLKKSGVPDHALGHYANKLQAWRLYANELHRFRRSA